MKAVQIKITGAVQGVGFRYSSYRKAQGLGLRGLVRNEPDWRSVSLEVEGDDEAVDEFIEWCNFGFDYPGQHQMSVKEIQPKGYKSFGVEM